MLETSDVRVRVKIFFLLFSLFFIFQNDVVICRRDNQRFDKTAQLLDDSRKTTAYYVTPTARYECKHI